MTGESPDPELRLVHEGIVRVLFQGAFADLWLRSLRRRAVRVPIRLRLVERRLLGVIESWRLLDELTRVLARRDPRTLSPEVRSILALGLWRLLYEEHSPDYAIVDGAVRTAKAFSLRTSGLVNAVLRRATREVRALAEDMRGSHGTAFAVGLPDFWEPRLRELVGAAEVDAALHGLRSVDRLFVSGPEPAEPGRLKATGIAGVWEVLDVRWYWDQVHPTGQYYVQDLSIAAWLPLAMERAQEPVLDAFAAPGGKLLAFTARGLDAVGMDHSRKRLALVASEARRRGLPLPVMVVGDARQPPFARGRFATVLADVPCTASGTVAAHPEVGLRTQVDDLHRFARRQGDLLEKLSGLVSPGGVLWYTTCSWFSEENEEVVEGFLKRHPRWRRLFVQHPIDRGSPVGTLRFWPHRHGCRAFVAQGLIAPPGNNGARRLN